MTNDCLAVHRNICRCNIDNLPIRFGIFGIILFSLKQVMKVIDDDLNFCRLAIQMTNIKNVIISRVPDLRDVFTNEFVQIALWMRKHEFPDMQVEV